MGTITINNSVTYPNKFLSTFGSSSLIEKWISNPANAVAALSGFSGVIIKNGFNSYATVKNKSKVLNFKDSKQEGSDFSFAASINDAQIKTVSQANISGSVYAQSFNSTNVNTLNSVLGAADLHIDIGIDRAFKIGIGKVGESGDFFKKNNKLTSLKEFLQWGNVGKNGLGAVVNVESPTNIAQTHLKATANLRLSGAFTNTATQTGPVVHVITASGSSNNIGIQGV